MRAVAERTRVPEPRRGLAALARAGLALLALALAPPLPAQVCSGGCATQAPTRLTVADVQEVIDRALFEAAQRGVDVTVAVVDRVGNVLGVVRRGPARTVTVTAERGVSGGLQGAAVPDTLAAIAKALTAAYLSSEGNAFSTRTANQIVQEFFNPGEVGQPSGPLYGVQFSQLPCSDLNTRGEPLGPGPKRSPLGLSADPGGLPLYKAGTPVGGVGVVVDGLYGLDRNVDLRRANDRAQTNPASNNFRNLDELVALAATRGRAAPVDRMADRITAGGLLLRFTDSAPTEVLTRLTAVVPRYDAVPSPAGALVAVPGYFDGAGLRAGTAFGFAESGFAPADDTLAAPPAPGAPRALDAFVLVDGAGANRYAPAAGTALTANEVRVVLQQALSVANRARAQIRRPIGTPARVTVSVVDVDGTVLGIVRSRDAPVFGADVSLQKARTAAFFSSPDAGAALSAIGPGPAGYVSDLRAITHPAALADGAAYTPRTIGNLARPFFPDGVTRYGRGPFSVEYRSAWSPFNTGLQLDLVVPDLVAALGGADAASCLNASLGLRLGNGMQIFPGGVPVFRNGVLVGGVGVSGDGVDQDDMVAFLGVEAAGRLLATGLGNAPAAVRADRSPGRFAVRSGTATVGTTGVRYIQCPYAPFINSRAVNVCAGK